MQKTPWHRQGYTLVELMLVMLLLALIGVVTLTLIQAGSSAYQKIADNRTAESDARVALNYLDVRIRQNDAEGMVRLEDNPLGEGRALVIREVYDDVAYDTWVYFADGVLYECNLLLAGEEEPMPDRSTPLATLVNYTFEAVTDNAIGQTATYTFATAEGSEWRTLSSVVTLRAGGGLQ